MLNWSTSVRAGLPIAALLVACSGPSASGVPAIDAAALPKPAFDGISPRSLQLGITDERTPLPETSAEMVKELERALGERFQSAGFSVAESAPNVLSLRVAYKDKPLPQYEREDCIWFTAKLTASTGRWSAAEGGACFELRNLYGMDLGGDASRAFETGLGAVIEQLDRSWAMVGETPR